MFAGSLDSEVHYSLRFFDHVSSLATKVLCKRMFTFFPGSFTVVSSLLQKGSLSEDVRFYMWFFGIQSSLLLLVLYSGYVH